MTEDDLQEEIDFWDDFALEYTQIQNESALNIVSDVGNYLAKQIPMKTETLVDLAGGSGKFLPVLYPLTSNYLLVDFSKEMIALAQKKYPIEKNGFIISEQNRFLAQSASQTYDILFSAMNPAIRTKKDLNEIIRVTKQKVYLLRVIQEEDALFGPFEEPSQDWDLMAQYKNWLDLPYQSHFFTYQLEEVITKVFFEAYFEDDLSPKILEMAVEKFFSTKTIAINRKTITFELLSINVNN